MLDYILLRRRSRITLRLERIFFGQRDDHPIALKTAQLKAHRLIVSHINRVLPCGLSWLNPVRRISRTYGQQVRTVITIKSQPGSVHGARPSQPRFESESMLVSQILPQVRGRGWSRAPKQRIRSKVFNCIKLVISLRRSAEFFVY